MSLKPAWKDSDIKKYLQGVADTIDTAILMRLSYIGETFVRNARNKGSYTDQTGNLRSSIGFIVLKDGKRVAGSSFEKVKDGTQGARTGKSLISELKASYSTGYALIVVAGMEYAAAVESRGKDVITGSSMIAKDELKKAMQGIKDKINGNG